MTRYADEISKSSGKESGVLTDLCYMACGAGRGRGRGGGDVILAA